VPKFPRRLLLATGTVPVALPATAGVRFVANAGPVTPAAAAQAPAVRAAAVLAHPA